LAFAVVAGAAPDHLHHAPRIATLYTYRTCPVQTFGRARTNPGRDRVITVLVRCEACVAPIPWRLRSWLELPSTISTWWAQLLYRNVQRFRGGLVFKAHRLLYHSTLGLRVTKCVREVGASGAGLGRSEVSASPQSGSKSSCPIAFICNTSS